MVGGFGFAVSATLGGGGGRGGGTTKMEIADEVLGEYRPKDWKLAVMLWFPTPRVATKEATPRLFTRVALPGIGDPASMKVTVPERKGPLGYKSVGITLAVNVTWPPGTVVSAELDRLVIV